MSLWGHSQSNCHTGHSMIKPEGHFNLPLTQWHPAHPPMWPLGSASSLSSTSIELLNWFSSSLHHPAQTGLGTWLDRSLLSLSPTHQHTKCTDGLVILPRPIHTPIRVPDSDLSWVAFLVILPQARLPSYCPQRLNGKHAVNPLASSLLSHLPTALPGLQSPYSLHTEKPGKE